MVDVIDDSITATYESGFESMALGTNSWVIRNDLLCQKGEVSKSLSLSACTDSEFTCGDGLCIDMDEGVMELLIARTRLMKWIAGLLRLILGIISS